MNKQQAPEGIGKLRCLVVDDHFPTRDMVKAILRSVGFRNIDTAEGGLPALSKIKEVRFDIIVCDWNMPDMKGIDVLRHVRQKLDSDVPFLMLTAEAYRENVKEALASGVSDYISKPFTSQVLCDKVFKLVKKA